MRPSPSSQPKFLKYFHTKLNLSKAEERPRKKPANPECDQKIDRLEKSMVAHLQTHILFIEKKLKEKNQTVDKLENQLYAANQKLQQQQTTHERILKKLKIQIKSLERVVEEWEARSLKWKINQVEDTVRVEKLAFSRFQEWKEKVRSIGKEIIIKEDPSIDENQKSIQQINDNEAIGTTQCSISADIKHNLTTIVNQSEIYSNSKEEIKKTNSNNSPRMHLSLEEAFNFKIEGQLNPIDISALLLQKSHLQLQIQQKNAALEERQSQIANILNKLRQDQQKILNLSLNINNQQQLINSYNQKDSKNNMILPASPMTVSSDQFQQTDRFSHTDFQIQTDQLKGLQCHQYSTETDRIIKTNISIQTDNAKISMLSTTFVQTQIIGLENQIKCEPTQVNNDLQNENNDLLKKVQQMEQERERMISYIEELQDERDSRDNQSSPMNQTSELQWNDSIIHQQESQDHKDELTAVDHPPAKHAPQNQKLSEMSAELTHYKSTLESLLSQYTLYREQSQSQMDSLSNECETLQQQLQEKDLQWEHRQNQLIKEIEECKEREEQLQQSVQALQEQLQSLKQMHMGKPSLYAHQNEQIEDESY